MRYYIYLDRPILRTLFSVITEGNWEIEVVEYSVRKSCTKNNSISVKPGIEKVCSGDFESNVKGSEQEEIIGRNRDGNVNRESIGVGYEHGSSSSIQTEKRYINIDDITDMKNRSFYHKLIEDIKGNTRDSNTRIYEEIGYINPYKDSRSQSNNDPNGFFKINESYVWFDKQKLDGDINLYSNFACKIHVVGYKVNCFEAEQTVIKAIAMYIE